MAEIFENRRIKKGLLHFATAPSDHAESKTASCMIRRLLAGY